ncbi:unnamed protein product [Trichobilharzia szidati]|nr:unnamed protein product [Trichobilharzia szidati]
MKVFSSLTSLTRRNTCFTRSACLPGYSAETSGLGVRCASTMHHVEDDKPVDMTDPYVKPKKKCFICEKNIPLDYKNVRLLSQFVSPYTGRIYGRHITGMCIPMQKRISKLITKSRQFGFMPFESKESVFVADPRISAPSKTR